MSDLVVDLRDSSHRIRLCRAAADRIEVLEAENERLREAVDALRGRFRLYTGWPENKWGGDTDMALLAMADAALSPQEADHD